MKIIGKAVSDFQRVDRYGCVRVCAQHKNSFSFHLEFGIEIQGGGFDTSYQFFHYRCDWIASETKKMDRETQILRVELINAI